MADTVKRLASWWRDDRVRVLSTEGEVSGFLARTYPGVVPALTVRLTVRVQRQANREFLRVVSQADIYLSEEPSRDVVRVVVTARAVGYPARRWLLAWDRVVDVLSLPMRVLTGER